MTVTFRLYRALFAPLLRLVFTLMGAFGHEKIRAGLRLREKIADADGRPVWPWLAVRPGLEPVWIHCASGEFEYAKPVITRLKKLRPDLPILVTFFSPSIEKAVRNFPGVDFATAAPWESPGILREFVEHHRPRALLIARTDTWPEMLHQARAAGIPTLLFSATLPPTSGRARGLGRLLSRAAFRDLDQIFCVSEEDRATFTALGCGGRTQVAGDTRYDQVMARLEAPKPIDETLFSGISTREVFVAGSTWTEDEAVLIEAAAQLNGRIRFVIVPHEPTAAHLSELESRLEAAGLRLLRYSAARSWSPAGEVLVVDRVGILAELYKKGAYAFVGGSFRKTVHSVMEPLAAGCLTAVGPLHVNNREALEFRRVPAENGSLTCVTKVENAAGLVRFLREAQAAPDAAGRIRAEIQERSGRSDLVVKWYFAHARN